MRAFQHSHQTVPRGQRFWARRRKVARMRPWGSPVWEAQALECHQWTHVQPFRVIAAWTLSWYWTFAPKKERLNIFRETLFTFKLLLQKTIFFFETKNFVEIFTYLSGICHIKSMSIIGKGHCQCYSWIFVSHEIHVQHGPEARQAKSFHKAISCVGDQTGGKLDASKINDICRHHIGTLIDSLHIHLPLRGQRVDCCGFFRTKHHHLLVSLGCRIVFRHGRIAAYCSWGIWRCQRICALQVLRQGWDVGGSGK